MLKHVKPFKRLLPNSSIHILNIPNDLRIFLEYHNILNVLSYRSKSNPHFHNHSNMVVVLNFLTDLVLENETNDDEVAGITTITLRRDDRDIVTFNKMSEEQLENELDYLYEELEWLYNYPRETAFQLLAILKEVVRTIVDYLYVNDFYRANYCIIDINHNTVTLEISKTYMERKQIALSPRE